MVNFIQNQIIKENKMEAFEEWYNGHNKALEECLNSSKKGFKLGLKIGWKAALGWIIKEQGSSYWVNEVSDLINKELNDE